MGSGESAYQHIVGRRRGRAAFCALLMVEQAARLATPAVLPAVGCAPSPATEWGTWARTRSPRGEPAGRAGRWELVAPAAGNVARRAQPKRHSRAARADRKFGRPAAICAGPPTPFGQLAQTAAQPACLQR